MTRRVVKRSSKIGLPPGTIVHIGEQKVAQVSIETVDYDRNRCRLTRGVSAAQAGPPRGTLHRWVTITGLQDHELLAKIGSMWGIHPLVLEDVANTHQRPKIDLYEDYLFLVLRLVDYLGGGNGLLSEQVSLILCRQGVLTFLERPTDVFAPVQERLVNAKGRLRTSGPDYLFYAAIDVLVDRHFLVLEKVAEEIEALTEVVLAEEGPSPIEAIHRLKTDLLNLRREVWPLREVIGSLARGESPCITDVTRVYLRDVYDHTVQIAESIDSYREMVTSLLEIYLSSLNNRMNEVMKMLTIIATIFIPLSFIAGVYGMNFANMPELQWRWGYPAVLAVMAVVTAVMLYHFRRRRWL
ncbi:MAG: magnesium/cobalt transporter CorA [candidate division KSB1 bacterium]|nr:magnesium/cobalt transporter CorA [candidate division KSB1 bacterium]MDZ7295433.1 magnesium/cobalt transporter CorA [candidate division KSB1 bacterium]MDZ7392039.1 magnesium/cobalt transporter CorA [candidate division KSB1 bacterium]MDZ7412767.1 magnesium/cobalt transporter CorA [candidate division KSB1 bacterium]